tara:strand:- start:58 stop:660 length:603 start_codon:yes stop_codon:yes gene_type:complete
MPIFSKQNKIILFIHIPKCGGSSISRIFQQNNWDVSFSLQGKNISEIQYLKSSPQHYHGEIIKNIFNISKFNKTFTIVRNPFNRLKSEYYWQLNNKISTNITPEDWLNNVIEKYSQNKYIFDNHIRPQNEFILEQVNIFKLEEGLKKVYEYIFDQRFFIFKEPKLKKSEYNHLIDEQFLKIKSKIEDFYADDYEFLKYKI